MSEICLLLYLLTILNTLLYCFSNVKAVDIFIKIKLQKRMNGIDKFFCKTDLILIHRLTFKCTLSLKRK